MRQFYSTSRSAQFNLQNAFRVYGKGRHAAALNFGDCLTYALAKSKGLPILAKGQDFALTDVEVFSIKG